VPQSGAPDARHNTGLRALLPCDAFLARAGVAAPPGERRRGLRKSDRAAHGQSDEGGAYAPLLSRGKPERSARAGHPPGRVVAPTGAEADWPAGADPGRRPDEGT
jgi:hypothetical protein